jgi:cell division protein ZapE
VAARGRQGATDDFDALCAHLATSIRRGIDADQGVTAVFLTGVHGIDESIALRLVSLTDRLYDAGIPVVASGRLDTASASNAGRWLPKEVSAGRATAVGADGRGVSEAPEP